LVGVLRAGCVFCFIGFDAVSTARSEKSKKGMPIGILGSLVICTILYVLFAYVLTGLENY
jgi:APA family basic amino acid/polyamine antiporter